MHFPLFCSKIDMLIPLKILDRVGFVIIFLVKYISNIIFFYIKLKLTTVFFRKR